jgi:DNA-binding HxlR family transcriptional regulator
MSQAIFVSFIQLSSEHDDNFVSSLGPLVRGGEKRTRMHLLGSSMRRLDTSYMGRVSRVIELLQGKWTVQILCAMRARPVRLSELKREIPSASKKALTASLRSLEAARVVLRRDLSSSVLHVEYELADAMREPLVALLDHLAESGKLYDSDEPSMMSPFDGQL